MSYFQKNNQLIQDLVTAALSEVTGKTIIINSGKSLGGGCINHASKLETNAGNFFLKWNDNCPADIFIREAESLKELKKAAGDFLVIPEVIAAKQADETPGFLVLEYLEGNYSSNQTDEKLGRRLAKIHGFSNSHFGFHNNNYCGATPQNNKWNRNWPEFFRENRLQFLLNLIDMNRPLATADRKLFDKLSDMIGELIPIDSTPVFIS